MATSTNTILRFLREKEGYVSGAAMSRRLGISRNAVWKHVEKLRRQGYRIESVTRRGHRLIGAPDKPTARVVRSLLSTADIGRSFRYEECMDSTNTDAVLLADGGAPHGTVVVADAQRAGRGRLGRQWHSPPGRNLYLSVVLRPAVLPARAPQLALVAAIALRRALRALCPRLPVKVKWPNDLFLGDRKLAGILCEMAAEADRIHHAVIGIGLNVNVSADDLGSELRERATSMLIHCGRCFPRAEVLAAVLNALEPAYDAWLRHGLAPFADELRRASLLYRRRISVQQADRTLCGTCAGVGADGALLLELADGRVQRLLAGDVHVEAY